MLVLPGGVLGIDEPFLLVANGGITTLPETGRVKHALQRMDTLAFGHLLEELLQRVDAADRADPRFTTLTQWHARCVDPDPQARPLMREVAQATVKPAGST